MYKLLPQKEIDEVRKEYSLRRISVVFALVSALAIFTVVSLAPSLIFALEKKKAAIFTLDSVNLPSRTIDEIALNAWVEMTKKELLDLTPDAEDQPYQYFKKIIGEKPAGISITSLYWSKLANGSKSLRVGGVASTRQSLLLFQSELKNTGEWSQVDFPVNAIARESDISFEISLVPQKPR